MSYLARLRALPLNERRQIALSWTLIIVAVIAGLWLVFMLSGLGSFADTTGSSDTLAPSSITPPYE